MNGCFALLLYSNSNWCCKWRVTGVRTGLIWVRYQQMVLAPFDTHILVAMSSMVFNFTLGLDLVLSGIGLLYLIT